MKIQILLRNIYSTAFTGFIASLLFLASCDDKKICKYKPSPIFEKNLPHITKYKYENAGIQSLESMVLDRGVVLEVYQEVCDHTRQEYRFTVPGGGDQFRAWPDSLWLMESTRQLVFLSTLSPKQAALKAWADVIETARPQMKLGEPFEVQEGISVKVDKVIAAEHSTLLVVFMQE